MRTPLAFFIALAASVSRADRVEFVDVFAPSAPVIAEAEKPYRDAICLNGRWQFQPVEVPRDWKPDRGQPPELTPPRDDRWDATPIKIPSYWNVNTWGNGRNVGPGTRFPYRADSVYFPSYPASWDGVRMAWMRRSVDVPAGWRDRRVLLHFDAVAGECRVMVNGQFVGQPHFDSYLPFDVDVTDAIKPDDSNQILVGVRSPHLFDLRSERYPKMVAPYPCGSNTDGLSGIWQDVTLIAVPRTRVVDVFVQPNLSAGELKVDVTLRNDGDAAQPVRVRAELHAWSNLSPIGDRSQPLVAAEPHGRVEPEPVAGVGFEAQPISVAAHDRTTQTLTARNVRGLDEWSPASPRLYVADVRIEDADGRIIDERQTRFGWREFSLRGHDLLLNGKPIQCVGDLTHPFGAYVMSRRTAWAWYTMVQDMGGNAVRLHAQPMPSEYLDLADEMGIVVLDESALFGSSIRLNFDSPQAWQRFRDHVDSLLLRDRNHPSVVGWSFGNELFAIFELNQVKPADADAWYRQLAQLGERVRALDPTRPWISCDGDEDLRETLPVWSKHFGHGVPLDRLPTDSDKPLMVGESGGTYYATPKQLSVFNGDRAYESYAGRNEALAIDAYNNVTQMARPRLAYFSPSEMVWFGLEHLNLGYRDFTRLPTKDDGVLLTRPYVEGQPGWQPERLPPYVTTLNPGWDPSLPLYRPLAMFEAFRAAMHQPSPLANPIERPAPSTTRPSPPPTITSVGYVGGDPLRRKLRLLGVPLAVAAASQQMVIVDASADVASAKPTIDSVRSRGGTVLICFDGDAAPSQTQASILPVGVERTDRTATMLVRREASDWTSGFSVPDLYFAEDPADRFVLKHGIAGPIVDRGHVLLEASNVDWSLFNNQPEAAKCGSIVLYEHLQKPSGAALLDVTDGGGHLVLSTIELNLASAARYDFWRRLLTGMGVQLTEPPSRWLSPIAIATQQGVDWRYSFDRPTNLAWTKPSFDDAAWSTGKGGIGERVPNARPRTDWRGNDVWLRRIVHLTQQDLNDINTDGVKLVVHYDENVQVYVNGIEALRRDGFTTRYESFDLPEGARRSLHVGDNVLAIHCSQIAGGKYIDAGLATGIVSDAQLTIDAAGHDLLLNGPRD